MRRPSKGFTLIEFLIALVIIGFIVALLVNFFADPLDEAQVGSDISRAIETMRMFQDADSRLRAKVGCVKSMAGTSCMGLISSGSATTEGIFTAPPRLPATLFSDGGPLASGSGDVLLDSGFALYMVANDNYWGTAQTTVMLGTVDASGAGVTAAACKEFNLRMGHGAVLIDPGAKAVDPAKRHQCVINHGLLDANADEYVILWPLYSY